VTALGRSPATFAVDFSQSFRKHPSGHKEVRQSIATRSPSSVTCEER
jgi:hypothetical protein